MKRVENPFRLLRRSPRPDLGDESRDFSVISIHRWCRESIQLRTRRHRDGFSTGWHVIMPSSGELDVYPTPETGLFRDERDAHLYALGAILTQNEVILTPSAKSAVQQAIAHWQQIPLFPT